MAAGFAFGHSGQVGYGKAAVAGSNLRLKGLPRNSKTVILHTRLATHGAVEDNRNNHPVLSPDNKIALVHNGVIWNHDEVRYEYLDKHMATMPDVDTSVIPALLQEYGTEGLANLSGDAAVAWLNSAEPNVLNLAKLESSPVSFTQLEDGSIVFASTAYLLKSALNRMGLYHGSVMDMDDQDYFRLEFGHIVGIGQTPQLQSFSTSAWWRHSTNGGNKGKPSHFMWDDSYDDRWDNPSYEDTENLPTYNSDGSAPMALGKGYDDGAEDDPMGDDLYYTIDQDGNFKSYRTMDALENDLKWHAGIANDYGDPIFSGDGLSRWMEYFLDVGSFGFEPDELISWVNNPSEIGYHEDPNGEGLGYIRDGVSILARVNGSV